MREFLEVLARNLDEAAHHAQMFRVPDPLPALLLELGVWSAEQALASVDRPGFAPPAQALVALAPLLSAGEALVGLARIRKLWHGHHDVAGALALARRVVALGEPAAALAAVVRLEPAPRGVVLARLAVDLPAEHRASAAEQALADLDKRDDHVACIALLALARALPTRRDELITRAMDALWRGDDGAYPYVLQWLAYAGAAGQARELALRDTLAYSRAQAIAAVLPYFAGAERRVLWQAWREAIDRALADGAGFVSLRAPLPAAPDELPELLALLRARPHARERAVALAHVARQHHECLDEALAAVRRLPDLDRALGLLHLLPVRPGLGREVLAALAESTGEHAELFELSRAWQAPTREPPVAFDDPTPRSTSLRARALADLPPDERRVEALKMLAVARRLGDGHLLASAIAALASGLSGADRSRALARAHELALASSRPFIGLSQVLRRLPPTERPALARVALDSMGDDDATILALPPVIAALPAELAGEQVLRVLRNIRSWIVHEIAAVVAAGLRAGAVAEIGEALLGGSGTRDHYFLHLLLAVADAGLRPRVVEAVLGPDVLDRHFDVVKCVPSLTDDELRILVARLPAANMRMTKQGGHRDPMIAALVRPFAQRGQLELLRPALMTLNRTKRLPALASALDLLPPDERETVARQLLGDLRRGDTMVSSAQLGQLAAAGHAGALLELPELNVDRLSALAPHISDAQRPRLRERMAAAAEAISSPQELDLLIPFFAELPDGLPARVLARLLGELAGRGREALFTALAGSEVEHGETETGLTRALIHLADPLAVIAELEASTMRTP